MDAYMIGNIVGRLLTSYFLVFFAYLVFNKFEWRVVLEKINSWVGVSIVLTVFFIGLLGTAL